MIYPVFMPKVYIEEKGRRIEVKNVINVNPEIKPNRRERRRRERALNKFIKKNKLKF